MKNVTVTIQIQMDVHSEDEEKIKDEVIDTLDSMSQNLQRNYMDNCPLIFTNSIDTSDILIHEDDEDEEE